MKLMMLALTAHEASDAALAAERYRDGLELFRAVGNTFNVNIAMTGLSALAAERGLVEEAARLLGMVEAVQEREALPCKRHGNPSESGPLDWLIRHSVTTGLRQGWQRVNDCHCRRQWLKHSR